MALELVVVTPEGQAFRDWVETVVLPGTEGYFGVLEGHEPFLTGLKIGVMEVEQGETTLRAAVSNGYANVKADAVTVMVGTCEFAHQIDVERAVTARERAQRQLEEMRQTEHGEKLYEEYQEAYSRAITRIAVSEKKPRA
jgi:F-type H+-transporting ATPase subunit epsilon